MRNRIARIALALVMSVTVILGSSPSSVTAAGGPGWSTDNRMWAENQLIGVGEVWDYGIPVCMSASMGGPGWDLDNKNRHARTWNAMQTWNDLHGDLRFYRYEGSCTNLEGEPRLRIVIGNTSNQAHADFNATMTGCPTTGSCVFDASITFEDKPSGEWYGGSGVPGAFQVDWQSVATHEIGHTMLCLPHSPTNGDTMYSPYAIGSWHMRTLTATDKLCYTAKYGNSH